MLEWAKLARFLALSDIPRNRKLCLQVYTERVKDLDAR